MIARLIAAEVAGLRRSFVPWLAMLLVVGGSVVARMLAWVTHAIGRTELGALPFVQPDVGWSDVAVPLALLAYLAAQRRRTRYAVRFTNVDLLASVVPRSAAWSRHLPAAAVLAAVAALGSAMAAIATLPLVAWAAIRLRGVLPALGLGIAIQIVALVLGGFAPVRSLPWFLPMALAAGDGASLLGGGLSALLFAGGLAAAVRALRSVDLYE